MESVAANVRRLRARASLTQEQLAETAGVDLSYLQRIERAQANATITVLVGLAHALEVKIGVLFRAARLPEIKRGRPSGRRA
jgi:transcriptional regulator with XRE-family HTH domain